MRRHLQHLNINLVNIFDFNLAIVVVVVVVSLSIFVGAFRFFSANEIVARNKSNKKKETKL